MYISDLEDNIFKNVTINSLKLLQDLDVKKSNLKVGLGLLLANNFFQFETMAVEKGYTIQVCTIGNFF